MRHELRTGDGELVWAGDPSTDEGSADLRALLYAIRNRARTRERYAMRIANGLCGACGIEPLSTTTRCVECAKQHSIDEGIRQAKKEPT